MSMNNKIYIKHSFDSEKAFNTLLISDISTFSSETSIDKSYNYVSCDLEDGSKINIKIGYDKFHSLFKDASKPDNINIIIAEGTGMLDYSDIPLDVTKILELTTIINRAVREIGPEGVVKDEKSHDIFSQKIIAIYPLINDLVDRVRNINDNEINRYIKLEKENEK